MLIDTERARRELANAGVPDEQAEAHLNIVRMIDKEARAGLATKSDLSRWAIRIILGNAAITAALLALFSYAS